MDIVAKAYRFAAERHGAINQRRRYTNEPYIVHPREVAQIASTVPHTKAMLCAAYLHDVIEDTQTDSEEILATFGRDVARLVDMLTDVSLPIDGNRAARKEIDRQHLARASSKAKTIKLADLISNGHSIVKYDKHFAQIFLREMQLLLVVLKEGDAVLWKRAHQIAYQS